jgi:hypothetical protein
MVASGSAACASTRANGAPQRISSVSAEARWLRPRAQSATASTSVVFPDAFGPQTSCGPRPNVRSSAAYARNPTRRSDASVGTSARPAA